MSEVRFNCVAIFDSIPDEELNTARKLRENLEDIRYIKENLQVRYFRIEQASDIDSAVSSLIGEASTGLKPWIHLEGHGKRDESGFVTASGTECSWAQFKDLITPLNIATDFNLFLILATCFGGSFTRAISTIDRAPVVGLIGPTRELTIGQIEYDFPAFYRAFFQNESITDALKALTSRAPSDLYYGKTAKRFFFEVWAGYKAKYCTEKMLQQRAKKMYRQAKALKNRRTPSVGYFKRHLKSNEANLFEEYRDKYFMYDLNPSNCDRFPVTYQEAEKFASSRNGV